VVFATYGSQAAFITLDEGTSEDTGRGFEKILQTLVLQNDPWKCGFYSSTEGTSYFDGVYGENYIQNTGSTLGLMPEVQGTGSAGYVFRITFEGAEAGDFFAEGGEGISMLVDESPLIENESNEGAETFYMGETEVNEMTPEPVTLVALCLGAMVYAMACKQ